MNVVNAYSHVNAESAFSQAIRAERLRRGLTLTQAGVELGHSYETVRRWEAGQSPDARGLEALELRWGLRRTIMNPEGSSGTRDAIATEPILRVHGRTYTVTDELAEAMMLLRRIYVMSKQRGNGRAWAAIKGNLDMFAALPENPEPPDQMATQVTPPVRRGRGRR